MRRFRKAPQKRSQLVGRRIVPGIAMARRSHRVYSGASCSGRFSNHSFFTLTALRIFLNARENKEER